MTINFKLWGDADCQRLDRTNAEKEAAGFEKLKGKARARRVKQ